MWAPYAERVDLVLDDARHPMRPVERGWWQADRDLAAGTRYRFALDGGEALADPRALRLPDGPSGPSEVVDAGAFGWTDAGWPGVALGCFSKPLRFCQRQVPNRPVPVRINIDHRRLWPSCR